MSVIKAREKCPICGYEDTSASWFNCPLKKKNASPKKSSYNGCFPNYFFRCHRCGFFFREYCYGEIKEGIILELEPQKKSENRQMRMIREHWKKMEELSLVVQQKNKQEEIH